MLTTHQLPQENEKHDDCNHCNIVQFSRPTLASRTDLHPSLHTALLYAVLRAGVDFLHHGAKSPKGPQVQTTLSSSRPRRRAAGAVQGFIARVTEPAGTLPHLNRCQG